MYISHASKVDFPGNESYGDRRSLKFHNNGISNHSSEYENVGSFHNLSKFRALYFFKLCTSRSTLMHSWATKSRRKLL